jgi:hypothetical protein
MTGSANRVTAPFQLADPGQDADEEQLLLYRHLRAPFDALIPTFDGFAAGLRGKTMTPVKVPIAEPPWPTGRALAGPSSRYWGRPLT